MGHESGLEHAGASKVRKPAAPPSGPGAGRLSDEQILATLEQNQLDEVRKLARVHTKAALGVLAAIAKNKTYSPAPRVTAAKAILEWGYGKPAAQSGPRQVGGDGKMRVIILKLADGTTEEIQEVDVTPGAAPVHEQVAGKRSVIKGVSILELTE
jgi:hypothetical protein